MPENEVPLIWTKNGNVPIDSLTQEVQWEFGEVFVKLVERWRDATGDVVKEGAHVYSKIGLAGDGAARTI
jgi:hypothetical protein